MQDSIDEAELEDVHEPITLLLMGKVAKDWVELASRDFLLTLLDGAEN